MHSISDQILGMELSEAEALLQDEGVTFVISYTEADRKKDIFDKGEGIHRIIRVTEKDGVYELIVCII